MIPAPAPGFLGPSMGGTGMDRRTAALTAAILTIAGMAKAAEAPKGATIPDPVWASMPSDSDYTKAMPAKAKAKRLSGHVTLSCAVGGDGRFTSCGVLEEAPLDLGFGDAAIVVADKYRMQPKSKSGKPTEGGEVVFPVNFRGEETEASSAVTYKSAGTVVLKPVWQAAPGRQDVAQAYGSVPSPRPASIRIIFRCNLKKDGGLSDCEAVNTSPESPASEAAAATLVSKFHADLTSERGRLVYPASVEFAVTLYDPAPEQLLASPTWVRAPSPQAVKDAFPKKAAAGVDHGQVGLDCIADSGGALTACKVVGEAPGGMDFGAAAMQLAAQMAVAPWTSDGRPVEGAHVQFAVGLDRPAH